MIITSNVPNVSDVVDSWAEPMIGYKIKKQVVDRVLRETRLKVKFQGVPLQPLTPQQLVLKPEGERMWKYYTLYSTYRFRIDDLIELDHVQYRVTNVRAWREVYGYWECELLQAYDEDEEEQDERNSTKEPEQR